MNINFDPFLMTRSYLKLKNLHVLVQTSGEIVVPRPVADPEFPRGGTQTVEGVRETIIWQFFAENFMEFFFKKLQN